MSMTPAPHRPEDSHPVPRPLPGPAPVRHIWNGETEFDPASLTPPLPPEPTPAASRWTRDAAFGPVGNPRRITGLDAARGFALIGMVAVHTLSPYNEVTNEPTLVWSLFAGHSAPLFAVLAGVTIALLTGANNPHTGRRLRRDRVSLVVRALLILLLGLGLDGLGLPVYNILAYYGLMFLFAIPFTRLRIRWLLVGAASFLVLGPVVIFLTARWGGYTQMLNPDFQAVSTMPTDTLITLLVGGTYPVITWMAYLCLGMALGRLNLRWLITQVRLLVLGGVAAATGFLTSTFLLDYAGGFEQLYQHTEGYGTEDIQEILDYGPEGHLPTDTWWWLTTAGPHTDTPLSTLAAGGLAVLAIGCFLVIARVLNGLLVPLIAAGSMTLTLYIAHMLFLLVAEKSGWENDTLLFLLQILGALGFATAWQLARGRGPLEEIMSRTCRAVSTACVPNREDAR